MKKVDFMFTTLMLLLILSISVGCTKEYTVVLDKQGGTGGTVSVTVITDEVMPVAKAPSKDGYIFGGYYSRKNGEGIKYYDSSMASNNVWDQTVSDATLYAEWFEIAVGNIGPAGGYIFYDKGDYSDGWRYLEAAPHDWPWNRDEDPFSEWAEETIFVGQTLKAIGTGEANTKRIVEKLGDGRNAAAFCADYVLVVNDVVYDDWFLPSLYELNLMRENLYLKKLGGFLDSQMGPRVDEYWSSSEYDGEFAWSQFFRGSAISDGSARRHKNNVAYRFRPVRAF